MQSFSAAVCLAFTGFLLAGEEGGRPASAATELVGRAEGNRVVLPVSQILTPAGTQVELPGLRPQALALSPDGTLLVTAGKTAEIVIVDPRSGNVLRHVALPSEKQTDTAPVSPQILAPDKDGQLSFTGLVFSPDGTRLYLSNVQGSIKVFRVGADGAVEGLKSIKLPPTGLPRRAAEIPAGLALSPDGGTLYVVGNLSNRLLVLDLAKGEVTRTFDVGVAPFDVVLVGTKAYVSNWGGRRPEAGDVVGPAGQGTTVRVDPRTYVASEGSLTIIDLAAGRVVKEVVLGLHASAMALAPSRRHLVVANAASDSLSIIDVERDSVVETLSVAWQPKDYFGASPNALAFAPDGKTLYACLGTQNAIAAIDFAPGASKLLGLIPVGWFPGAVLFDARGGALCVANIKGHGSGRRVLPGAQVKYNSHQHSGTLTLVKAPDAKALVGHTRQVLANCRREMLEAAQLPPRPDQPPRPVPERAGEPSVFTHAVYIIKENRTYDQVFGDVKEGNGDPALCVFGEQISPNHHALARQFVLLDNTYCSGVLSADGHQWATTAFATDYMEKSFAGFPRSYPDGMGEDEMDALAYAPTGFIWDLALLHGKTLRDYGEFAIPDCGWQDRARKPEPTFSDYYRDFVEGKNLTRIGCRPAIETLRPYLCAHSVGWAMEVPDVLRADRFIRELAQYEAKGDFPNLVLICLPNDHTSGTREGYPTPAAHVADNDLALGRIVEAISASRFWKDTCIFVIEDDPQDGWDHVSAYRTVAFVVSPYTKRGAVVSTQYNQPGMLRTIELILGLPPMNQMDAAATPMTDCFTVVPDFRPYKALPNRVPLDQLNPKPSAVLDPVMREDAIASASLPLESVDRCPEGLLNRIIWRAQRPGEPYPAWATRHKDGEKSGDGQ